MMGGFLCFVARDRIAVRATHAQMSFGGKAPQAGLLPLLPVGSVEKLELDPVTGGDATGINWKIKNSNQIRGESERSSNGTENLWHHHPR